MPKVTAHIEPVEHGEGLWLLIDNPNDEYVLEDADAFKLIRNEFINPSGDTVFPVQRDEVEAVLRACQKWLDAQESQVDQIADRVLEAND